MKITIITDASIVRGKCGFAFYIGCTKGKIQRAGELKMTGSDTVLAEFNCIANALHMLKHSKYAPITKVWLWCDNIMCVKVIKGEIRTFRSLSHRQITDEIHFLMMEICLREGKSIRTIDAMFEVNHIQGHTGNKDKLSVIQNWCDENARKYAKQKTTKKR